MQSHLPFLVWFLLEVVPRSADLGLGLRHSGRRGPFSRFSGHRFFFFKNESLLEFFFFKEENKRRTMFKT